MDRVCKIINLLLMVLLLVGIIHSFYLLDRIEVERRPAVTAASP
jgi:hypothetical protein